MSSAHESTMALVDVGVETYGSHQSVRVESTFAACLRSEPHDLDGDDDDCGDDDDDATFGSPLHFEGDNDVIQPELTAEHGTRELVQPELMQREFVLSNPADSIVIKHAQQLFLSDGSSKLAISIKDVHVGPAYCL